MPAYHSSDDPKNQSLLRQLDAVLDELEQELVPEDRIVAEHFLSSERHTSVQGLKDFIQERHPEVDISHVRRTLRMLCDLGIARKLTFDDRTVYEHLHPGDHHDHMLCTRCGRIEEFVSETIEAEQFAACRTHGFQPLMHTLVIRGICSGCAEQIPPSRLLASCLPGETVEVVEVLGGSRHKQRLVELGLVRGSLVRVLRNDGPVAIEVRGSRIAIGRGQAMKVVTRRAESTTVHAPND